MTNGLSTYSASRIKAYKECARLYQHKYITAKHLREEEDKNTASLLGTGLHKAIEAYYRSNARPTAVFQEYMTTTVEQWEEQNLTIRGMEYLSKNIKLGKEILAAFDWNQFNPIALEHNFTLPFPNKDTPIVNINGIIDLLDMSGMVVDFKSAGTLPSPDELNNDIQFIIYYWAYEQLYNVAPWKVIWYHLRTNKQIEINIAADYSLKIQQLTLDIQAMLHHSEYYARKKMDSFCLKNCSFYELCYGKRAKDREE